MVLSDIKQVPRIKEGDIEVTRCAFKMNHYVDRLCALKLNGAEERYTVRVVVRATRCYYRTIKVNMLDHPEIFEPMMDRVKITDEDAQAPNLWHKYRTGVKVSMECGWFKVNKPALMEFIKTVHWKTADQCNQRELFIRSNYIQVVHDLKFNTRYPARIGISI